MKPKHLLGFLFAMTCVSLAQPAKAVTCTVAQVFSTGMTLTAANMNANPASIVNCVNQLDHTNIGSAGIYASQLIPGTGPQATFGGSQTYTFPAGIVVNGTQTTTGVVTSGGGYVTTASFPFLTWNNAGGSGTSSFGSGNFFNVLGINNTSLGLVTSAPGQLLAVDLAGNMGLTGQLRTGGAVIAGYATALAGITPGELASSTSTTQGALLLGGSVSGCSTDFNITVALTDFFGCAIRTGQNITGASIIGTGGTFPLVYRAGAQQTTAPKISSTITTLSSGGGAATYTFPSAYAVAPFCSTGVQYNSSTTAAGSVFISATSTTGVSLVNFSPEALVVTVLCVGQ
jgi:hypothetical protein